MVEIVVNGQRRAARDGEIPTYVGPQPKTPEEKRAEVQATVARMLGDENGPGEEMRALAKATLDLVMAAVAGQLDGRDRDFVGERYRERIISYLEQERGL